LPEFNIGGFFGPSDMMRALGDLETAAPNYLHELSSSTETDVRDSIRGSLRRAGQAATEVGNG